MSRLTAIVLLLVPLYAFAQEAPILASAFRSHNPNEDGSVFMENESRPLPRNEETTYSITITVTNIRNTEGVIRFKFYDEATPFPDDKGFLRIVVPKSSVIDNTFTATYYGFPARVMGIALLDDENNNWELDKGWFFPKEGHAFSDYYHTSLRRPVYSDFTFQLTSDKRVTMKMKYY